MRSRAVALVPLLDLHFEVKFITFFLSLFTQNVKNCCLFLLFIFVYILNFCLFDFFHRDSNFGKCNQMHFARMVLGHFGSNAYVEKFLKPTSTRSNESFEYLLFSSCLCSESKSDKIFVKSHLWLDFA